MPDESTAEAAHGPKFQLAFLNHIFKDCGIPRNGPLTNFHSVTNQICNSKFSSDERYVEKDILRLFKPPRFFRKPSFKRGRIADEGEGGECRSVTIWTICSQLLKIAPVAARSATLTKGAPNGKERERESKHYPTCIKFT